MSNFEHPFLAMLKRCNENAIAAGRRAHAAAAARGKALEAALTGAPPVAEKALRPVSPTLQVFSALVADMRQLERVLRVFVRMSTAHANAQPP